MLAIPNLDEFARKHGLPIRTLRRIKAVAAVTSFVPSYAPCTSTLQNLARVFEHLDKLEKRRMARAAKASKPKGKK